MSAQRIDHYGGHAYRGNNVHEGRLRQKHQLLWAYYMRCFEREVDQGCDEIRDLSC